MGSTCPYTVSDVPTLANAVPRAVACSGPNGMTGRAHANPLIAGAFTSRSTRPATSPPTIRWLEPSSVQFPHLRGRDGAPWLVAGVFYFFVHAPIFRAAATGMWPILSRGLLSYSGPGGPPHINPFPSISVRYPRSAGGRTRVCATLGARAVAVPC